MQEAWEGNCKCKAAQGCTGESQMTQDQGKEAQSLWNEQSKTNLNSYHWPKSLLRSDYRQRRKHMSMLQWLHEEMEVVWKVTKEVKKALKHPKHKAIQSHKQKKEVEWLKQMTVAHAYTRVEMELNAQKTTMGHTRGDNIVEKKQQ